MSQDKSKKTLARQGETSSKQYTQTRSQTSSEESRPHQNLLGVEFDLPPGISRDYFTIPGFQGKPIHCCSYSLEEVADGNSEIKTANSPLQKNNLKGNKDD